MLKGKVVGNIVSTQKLAKLVGYKLLVVEIAPEMGAGIKQLIALDTLSAGEGETVLLALGSSARRALGDDSVPADAVIVGIVDRTEDGPGPHHGT